MSTLSLRRKLKSTAFLSHWLTFHEFGPVAPGSFSATRALPRSSRSSASSTASRTSPLVAGVIVARSSKAFSIWSEGERRSLAILELKRANLKRGTFRRPIGACQRPGRLRMFEANAPCLPDMVSGS